MRSRHSSTLLISFFGVFQLIEFHSSNHMQWENRDTLYTVSIQTPNKHYKFWDERRGTDDGDENTFDYGKKGKIGWKMRKNPPLLNVYYMIMYREGYSLELKEVSSYRYSVFLLVLWPSPAALLLLRPHKHIIMSSTFFIFFLFFIFHCNKVHV